MPNLVWGLFPFSVKTLPHQKISKTTDYRYGTNNRLERRPSKQFLGFGDETITVEGVLYPLITGGRNIIEIFKYQAEQGKGFPLIERNGRIHGFYVCTNASEVASIFERDGLPNKVEFTLKFERVGDDSAGLLSILSTQIGGILDI